MPARSYKRENARVIYSDASSKAGVSKYKSQAHFLDAWNTKFPAQGFSPLNLNTGIKT